jgi:hypothetical protein
MTTNFGAMPAPGTPQHAELVRRQTALGLSPNLGDAERERLLREERLGVTWVANRPPAIPRPRKSTAARPVAPSIAVRPVAVLPTPRPRRLLESTPPPVLKRWYQFWK